jgi:gluconokinase
MYLVIIVMGVSGAGKSTVAQALASALNLPYFDADDFHSDVNKAKMASGEPLTDADREPWLDSLAGAIGHWQNQGNKGNKGDEDSDKYQGAVLACSALKESYRKRLMGHSEGVRLVYLKANYEEIHRRMEQRQNHYMKADMLKSQFAALEEPVDAIVVNASLSIEKIVGQIITSAKLKI